MKNQNLDEAASAADPIEPMYDRLGEAFEKLRNALEQLKQARLVQKVFMGLGQTLSLRITPEKFLAMIVEAVRSLFGNAHYLVQISDPNSLTPIAFDSRGPLQEGVATKIHLTRSSIQKTHLDPSATQVSFVTVHDTVPRLFVGSSHAIHVPLVADNQLFGAIQLESPPEAPLGDDDEVLLISLANQMALAIRNQRLLEETAFLKDYMANILEHANALILVANINRQILVYNQAIENLLGFPKEEVLGTDLFQWIPQEEQDRFSSMISQVVKGAPSASGVETRMRNREGEAVQIFFHLAALRDREGHNESLILVGQDITKLRALERQVIEAEKMASLGKLAAGVVHELNNPLTSISVYAEYLVKKLKLGKTEAGDVEKMERILEGARRIHNLTRDLVSYGRPSAEEPELLQVNDLVAQGLSFCEHIISKHDVRVSYDLLRNLPLLCANRNQLLQVIINLVTNACQAMDGGGELNVSTKLLSPDRLCLVISDTGMGIPAKDLRRIFEPFFTTKKDGQGTGLGLSIVSRIVEHHRGSIEVSSTLGVGTSFEIQFPLMPNGHVRGDPTCEPKKANNAKGDKPDEHE